MKISNRLKTIADLVTYSTFADIGTDHGYAPIYLVETGKVEKAIACDLRKAPLEKASENIKKSNLSNKIETRLGSGFSQLNPNEIECALIAGMGGMLIIQIIQNDMEVVKNLKELILSPHEDVKEVRHFLHSINFSIAEEIMLKDGGKIYTAMRCLPIKEANYEKEIFYSYGKILLEQKEPLILDLINTHEQHTLKALENIEKAYKDKEKPADLLNNINLSIAKIKEVREWFQK